MKNQKGFSLVLIIGLLPILISITLGIYYLNSWLMPNENTLHLCRSILLKAEENAGKKIQSILALNKSIVSLRKTRLIAEHLLQVAILTADPPAIAAAELALESIMSAQEALRARQSLLIAQGNQIMISTPYSVQRKITASIEKTYLEYQPHFKISETTKREIPKLMAIRKIESVSPGPPTYELEDAFTKKQALHVSWILSESLQKRSPIWKKPSLSKSLSCAASLKQEEGRFSPVLLQDKFFLNSYF